MKRRMRCGALLLACAFGFVLSLPAGASAAAFLELSGIPGESTLEGLPNQIEISDFSFEVGRDQATTVDLRSNPTTAFSGITVRKKVDRTSPALMLRAANGAVIPSARIRFTEPSAQGQVVFLRYCLTGVFVAKYDQSGVGGVGERPEEAITLFYKTIVQSYTQQAASGGQGTIFDEGWDLVRELQFGGACDN